MNIAGGLRILTIEDNPQYASFLKEVLGNTNPPNLSLEHADRLSAGLQTLSKGKFDVVLLDLNLPDAKGLETLRRARAAAPDTPIVVLTGIDEEPLAMKALEEGAQDYLIKGHEDRSLLERYIRFAIERHRRLAATEKTSRASQADAAAFFQVILRNADGIMIVDRNGVVRFANPAIGTIFGCKAEDFIGKGFGFPVVEGQTTELDIPKGNTGETVVVEMRVAGTEWEGQSGYIASLRDITKLKKTTRSLMAANQKLKELQEIDRLKSTFISNVSHELRTPLTVIMSSANNLLDGLFGGVTEAQQKWLKKIQNHAQRLQDLISDILDLSKLESGKSELNPMVVNMDELIKRLTGNIQSLTDQKKINLVANVEKNLPQVWASESRIEQVLTNLIANATKFTPAGGTITVSAKHEKDYIEIVVSDTGIGIAPEHREVIFERFKQVDNADPSPTKGIGLGLAICAEIVAQHRGRIWVESDLGKGSHFHFRIPVDFRKTQTPKAQPKTILVVDDDPNICDLLAVVLSKKGYQVDTIKDGKEALDVAGDQNKKYDVIFLDLMMPGTNGLEVLKLMRKTHPDTRVAILTAYPQSDLSRDCIELSSIIVTKPFDIEQIQRVAEKLFKQFETAHA